MRPQKEKKLKKEKKPVARLGGLLDPKVDFVFKNIFGKDKEIFCSFANSVIQPPQNKLIIDIEFTDKDLPKNYEKDKESRLDVLATLKDKSKINIEIQLAPQAVFDKRVLYYWGKLYSTQLKESQSYSDLQPVVCISLLNFIFDENHEDVHTKYVIQNIKTKVRAFHEFEIHFIEIPKFNHKIKTMLDKWINFLLSPAENITDPTIQKARNNLNVLSLDEDMRVQYEARLKQIRDEYAVKETAENKKYNEGLEKGLQEGHQKGIQEGIQKGLVEKSIEIAKKLKSLGFSEIDIQKTTGLPRETIKKNIN